MTRPADVPAGAEYVASVNVALVDPEDATAVCQGRERPDCRAFWRFPPAKPPDPPGPFRVLERFHLAIAVVTIVAATVFLLALTIMLVDERRETVGVLRLIGLPVRRILAQILLEGLLVAGVGAAFGLVLAMASRTTHQPVLPVALRHGARLRPRHEGRRAHLRGHRRSARRVGDRGGVVGAPAPRRTQAGQTMNAIGFAWRSLVRQPARAALGILGVAAVGALLFDMLLLSRGLIVSMQDCSTAAGGTCA